MKKLFNLSSSGLKNLVINNQNQENEFQFIFKEGTIVTNKIFAEFISPLISHIHHCDPTISSFTIEDSNTKSLLIPNTDLFPSNIILQIQQLIEGNPIEINNENERSFRFLALILNNEEMYQNLMQINPNYIKNKNIKELIDEIIIFDKFLIKKIEFNDIIDRFSQEFSNISIEEIEKLPKWILYFIISSDKFQHENEDKLFDLILKMRSRIEVDNENYIELFEVVDFTKLSDKKFSEFLEIFDYQSMNHVIWTNLCHRFINHQKTKANKIEIDYSENQFKGIIHHLTELCGGNVSEKGVVDVTSSSTSEFNNVAKYAVDLDEKNYFASSNKPNQWLKFDFKDWKIHPTGYSIRSRCNSSSCNPQNWCIEVSNTGNYNEWKLIDLRKNVTTLQNSNATGSFKINEKLNDGFRFIRLRQTGKSTDNFDYLIISAIEFFGTLIKNT